MTWPEKTTRGSICHYRASLRLEQGQVWGRSGQNPLEFRISGPGFTEDLIRSVNYSEAPLRGIRIGRGYTVLPGYEVAPAWVT